jgi:hypothetical protein
MDQRKYKEAKKKVRTKKEFYEHLTVFSVMSVFFFLLNALTAFGSWWFYWPILGWGIGVLFHYFEVFGFPGIPDMSKEWEEQQIREEMKRLEGRNKSYELEDDYEELELPQMEKEKEKKKWKDDDLV